MFYYLIHAYFMPSYMYSNQQSMYICNINKRNKGQIFHISERLLDINRYNLIWRPVLSAGVFYTLVARRNEDEPWREVCTPTAIISRCKDFDSEGIFSCLDTHENSIVETSSVDVLLGQMKWAVLSTVLTVDVVAEGNCSSYNRKTMTCTCGKFNVYKIPYE